MGVADRGYMRGRGPPRVALGASWTLRFVVLTAAAFLVVGAAKNWFHWRGAESLALSREALREGRWWTLVTAAFVHADAWHLVFNLLGLWYFGRLCEETLGSAKFAAFFSLAIVLSHAPFVAAAYATGDDAGTVGISGVVMATLVFAAFKYPGMPFTLIVLPVKLWQLAVLYVAVDLWGAASGGGWIDHWTHLGGAAFGLAVHRWGLPSLRLPRRRRAAPARGTGPYRDGNVRREVDRLLDKINREGIGSLTDDEREFLKTKSGQYR